MELAEIDKKLSKLQHKQQASQRAKKKLYWAEKSLSELRDELQERTRELKKEERDVKQFEGFSLKALLYFALGSEEEQLEKERHEFVKAKLKYDLCKNSITAQQEEIEQLRLIYLASHKIETGYRSLLHAKAKKLHELDKASDQQLSLLSEQLTQVRIDEVEIQEALQAGKAVQHEIQVAHSYLSNADSFRVWDRSVGDHIGTFYSQSHKDEARDAVHRLQFRLARFQRELNEINIEVVDQLQHEGLTNFGAHFLDGLVSDWIVQARFSSSLELLLEMRSKVDATVGFLCKQHQGAKYRVQKFSEEWERAILAA